MCALHVCCSSAPQQQVIVQDSKILQHMSATGMVSQKEKQDTTLVLAFLHNRPAINPHQAVTVLRMVLYSVTFDVFCHLYTDNV